ncbi:glycosyltransferase family 4 protein [Rhizobium wenxiniae]|uniref:glycosyltransferase family 4 protein n=1 Tax=Rhizobium wenxiniae TaxID=1737357 RepID=UPI003C28EA6C
MSLPKENLVIVQYAGDFREAALRLSEGGAETYRAQRYTVDYVQSLASRYHVTTITGFTAEPYDSILPSGARAIGAGFTDRFHAPTILDLVRKTNPDRLILRLPNPILLRWAARKGVPTLALLADSFPAKTLKERFKRRVIAHYLKSPNVTLAANHGKRATRQLVDIGVPANKVVAWDFPAQDTPYDREAKLSAQGRKILYAGLLSAPKGVDDLLHATASLKRDGKPITVDLYGKGETDRLTHLAKTLGIGTEVNFKGLVANSEMVPAMSAADIVVVPSRHDYSEGLPLTIYEALCSRTPLVASDHPMFLENIEDGFSCVMFPGGNASALATKIDGLLTDAALYSRLSANAPEAWEKIQILLKWADVIEGWLASR